MAVKSGRIIHTVDGFVLDRIQTAGPGQVNVNEEKIYELGNFESVGTVRDNPDLSFSMDSLDVSVEAEALLTLEDPTAAVNGDVFSLNEHCPIDVISPWKSSGTAFTISHGVIVPFLTLESATYSFGIRDNATQNFGLRGDGLYVVQGSPRAQVFTVTAGANQSYNFTNTALVYTESGDNLFAISATAKNTTTKTYKRLFFGDNYTNTSTAITVIDNLSSEGYNELHVTYNTATVDSYPQTVHQDASVKPAAVRGRDIDVYLGTSAATPTFTRWTGVQSADINWSVTLDADEEFGNSRYVSQDYDVPEVSGSVTMRARDAADLFAFIQATANTSQTVVGPLSSVALPMEIHINDPDTGSRLKTFYIPDARFTPPGINGQVQTKLEVEFAWTSDGGALSIYKGARPGGA